MLATGWSPIDYNCLLLKTEKIVHQAFCRLLRKTCTHPIRLGCGAKFRFFPLGFCGVSLGFRAGIFRMCSRVSKRSKPPTCSYGSVGYAVGTTLVSWCLLHDDVEGGWILSVRKLPKVFYSISMHISPYATPVALLRFINGTKNDKYFLCSKIFKRAFSKPQFGYKLS